MASKIKKRTNKYYVYIVECNSGTYYTGYTNDLEKRIKMHNKGLGAKYTRSRRPVKLVWYKEYKCFKEEFAFDYKILTKDNIRDCLFFQEEWCLAKDCQHTEGLTKEKEAMQEMLTHFQALGVRGAMIEVNGKVEAVTLGEPLNPETFVIHIEKANGALVGIYQAINQAFCAKEAADFKYVNREQDLGVPGLRKSKESYHPCTMIKKYNLSAQ